MRRRLLARARWLLASVGNATGRFLDRIGGLNPDHSEPYRRA